MGNSPIQTAREKLVRVLETVNSKVIGHEEENKMLLLCLVAKEHAVIIGAPGTAKSYTLQLISKLIGAKYWKYMFTRTTTDTEVLGTFDVKVLREAGELKRKWTEIVNADILIFEEVFKGSSIILNALLSLLQERIVYDPVTGAEIQTKVWTVFGTSNEVPAEEELQAFYDRFTVRIFVDYLQDDVLILRALEARWLQNNSVTQMASMDDVRTLHEFALRILRSTVKALGNKPFVHIYHASAISMIKDLRSKGIVVSDRTIIEKLPKLVASYCALFGVTLDNVMNSVIELLPYLAHDKSERDQIKKYLNEALGEVGELAEALERVRALVRSGNLEEALKTLEDRILSFDLSKLASRPWLKPRAEAIIQTARQYYEKLRVQLETLKKMAEEL